MSSILWRPRAAGALAALVLLMSCQKDALVTAPRGAATDLTAGTPTPEPERACAQLTVALHGNTLDQVVLAPAAPSCGTALGIVLAGPAQLDAKRNVLRVPVALTNSGTRMLRAPARVYGWDDSLLVTSPSGLAKNKHTATYLALANPDSAISSTGTAYPGAVLWRLDSLLAASGLSPHLAPGAQSSPRWIEIAVKQGVQGLSAMLWAEVAVAIPAAPIVVVADTTVTGSPLGDTSAYVGDLIAYRFTARAGYENVAVRVDGRAAPASGTVMADAAYHAIEVSADRVVTVPAGLGALYGSAQAILVSSDVPAAFQAWLDAAYAHMQESPDPELAQRQIGDIEYLAFDPVTQYDNLRRADAPTRRSLGSPFASGPTPWERRAPGHSARASE